MIVHCERRGGDRNPGNRPFWISRPLTTSKDLIFKNVSMGREPSIWREEAAVGCMLIRSRESQIQYRDLHHGR